MSLEDALRLCEIGLAIALAQQSLEHLALAWQRRRVPQWGRGWPRGAEAALFATQCCLSLWLGAGGPSAELLGGLTLIGIMLLVRFDGPYNGGSDRLGLLLRVTLLAARVWPEGNVPRLALGYLAMQVVSSYALAGVAKLAQPDWRTGRALVDLLRMSAYPAGETLRHWHAWPRLLRVLGWTVIGLELSFPIALVDRRALAMAMALTGTFHVANGMLLGLNRFLWVWLATYPALLWFQAELVRAIATR